MYPKLYAGARAAPIAVGARCGLYGQGGDDVVVGEVLDLAKARERFAPPCPPTPPPPLTQCPAVRIMSEAMMDPLPGTSAAERRKKKRGKKREDGTATEGRVVDVEGKGPCDVWCLARDNILPPHDALMLPGAGYHGEQRQQHGCLICPHQGCGASSYAPDVV